MGRKIMKVLISLLFLIVAAIVALLGIKNFMPDLFCTPKYGLEKPGEITPARKTPAFKKDIQKNKYGVAPVRKTTVTLELQNVQSKYGVAPIEED